MTTPNKFRARCYRCGEWVEAGQGVFHFEDHPAQRWPEARYQRNWPLTEHVACHEKHAGTNVHYLMSPQHESS